VAGVATGDSGAMAAAMGCHGAPQPTRWLRAQVHTRTTLWRGVVMGGRLVGGNSAGIATQVSRGRGRVWEGNERCSRSGA
jgi:hypothetical protein